MRRATLLGLSAISVAMCLMSVVPAQADGPEFGANVGAAVPLKKYSHTIEGVGGTTGVSLGYRFDLNPNFSLSLLANPQAFFLGTEEGCCRDKRHDDDINSLLTASGGPKFTFSGGPVEAFVMGQGGYYWDLSGALSDKGPGYNISTGINFDIGANNSVGFFGRYDLAYMRPEPGNGSQRKLVSGGLAYTHVFQPPERIAEAPPPPPPPPPPPAVRTTRKIVLRGVNFDFDKSNIRADARPILDEAIRTLQEEREVQVSVEGHTDAIGSIPYNQRLSERRANSVADYLSRGGIRRSRLRTVGYGKTRPVATNETADGRAQNRRVELHIVGD
jgi:outer membrane protein OmpA-like peptidoglycan-associated protein